MSTTEVQAPPPTIVQALAAVMAHVRAVGKDGCNTHQNYKFRGIDAVVNAVGPVLREYGVIVVPHVQSSHYDMAEVGEKRSLMRQCTVTVLYRFHGPAGDTLDCVVPGESMDSGDKATPKAMSVAFRTALLQALCLPTDEPDPDSHSYERSAVRAQSGPSLPPVVTDPEWLAAIQQDIAHAEAKDDLTALWDTIKAEHAARRVSDDDRNGLSKRVTDRLTRLGLVQPTGASA